MFGRKFSIGVISAVAGEIAGTLGCRQLHVLLLVIANIALIASGWSRSELEISSPPTTPVSVQSFPKEKVVREKQLLSEILAITNRIQSDADLIESLAHILNENRHLFNIIHTATVLNRLSQTKVLETFVKSSGVWSPFSSMALTQVSDETEQSGNLRTAASVVVNLSKAGLTVPAELVENLLTVAESQLDTSSLIQIATSVTKKSVRARIVTELQTRSGLAQADLVFLIFRGASAGIERLVLQCDKFVPQGLSLVAGVVQRTSGTLRTELERHIRSRFVSENEHLCTSQDVVAAAALTNSILLNRAADVFFDLPLSFIHAHMASVTLVNTDGLWKSTQAAIETKTIDWDKLRLSISLLCYNGETLSPQFVRSVHSKLLEAIGSTSRGSLFDFLSIWREIDAESGEIISAAIQRHGISIPALAVILLENPTFECPPSIKYDDKERLGQVVSVLAGLADGPLRKQVAAKFRPQLSRFCSKNLIEAINDSVNSHVFESPLDKEGFVVGSFGPACRAAARTTSARTKRALITFAETQVPYVTSRVLIDSIQVLAKSEKLVIELTSRINAGTLTLNQVVTILKRYSTVRHKVNGLDDLFQALKRWLVPMIPKLNLDEIAQVTCALEKFGSRTVQDESSEIMTP